jgi:hypothetical protein
MALTELVGYVAAALVLATFSMRSIAALRSVAIASNLMFIAYAGTQGLLPVLVLHALLLPLNVWRLCEAATAVERARPRFEGWPRAMRSKRARRVLGPAARGVFRPAGRRLRRPSAPRRPPQPPPPP